MKKITIFSILIIMLILGGCTKQTISSEKLTVAVSIVPQETFVKMVAGDLINIITMIPPGASAESYGPSTKEMIGLSKSKIYFSIGVPAEQSNILPKLKDFNKEIKVISLADEVSKVYPHLEFEEDIHNDVNNEDDDHRHKRYDPHIWMSPKRAKIMIEEIKKELINIDSKNAIVYTKNADEYIKKLDELDDEIKSILSGLERQSFIIYHPSLGYFADDYGLNMIAIEEEGKEATAKRIQEVIDIAKNKKIKFIFYQEEFDPSQAKTIAKEISGRVVKVAPLSPNYIDNLKLIANTFKDVLKD